MWLRLVSLDKNVHKNISLKVCFTPEENSKNFGACECVGIGLYHVACRKCLKICSVYFELLCCYFISSRSRKRFIPVSKRVDVSRPSIYMN